MRTLVKCWRCFDREDEARAVRKAREECQGYVVGRLIVIAAAVGLGIVLIPREGGTAWSIALVPLLVGFVLLGVALYGNPNRQVK
jgi:hypothetical protein